MAMTWMAVVAECRCFHCGLPVADPRRWTILIGNEPRALCCPACQSVAGAIVAGGLEQYYQYRSALAVKPELVEERRYLAFDDAVVQQAFVRLLPTGDGRTESEAQLLIGDIHCAACCWLLEQALQKIPGVSFVSVNLASHKAILRWDATQEKLSSLFQHIHALGYQPSAYQPAKAQDQQDSEHRVALRRLGIAGIGMMQAMMFALALYSGDFSAIESSGMDPEHKQFMRWFSLLVTLPVLFYSAQPFFKGAWRNLKSRSMGMDVPISLALLIAFFASLHALLLKTGEVYFDSISMFVFLLLLARFAESRARRRLLGTSAASVLPLTCQCLTRHGEDSDPVTVPVQDIRTGDVILVKAGETIPLDAIVINGSGSVNEAAFSGEQEAQAKSPGDVVYAGTINGDGVLTLRVTALAGDNRFDIITRLSEWSETQKPRISEITGKLASLFTVFVLLLALSAGIYWYWQDSKDTLRIVLSILVVSCPCALSLATPSALAFCYQALRKAGLLVTSSKLVEQLRDIDTVVFDKTGTLTDGHFSISRTHVFGAQDQYSQQQLLEIAAALELNSEHPLASAFRHIATDIALTDVHVVSGKGVEACYKGVIYRIGSQEFCAAQVGRVLPLAVPEAKVYLASQQQWLACFVLDDRVRNDAATLVNNLQAMGKRVELLSGDSSGAAGRLAGDLHIPYCRSHASPEDKLAHIRLLQQEGRRVLMVGDGINDIPVLAQADVSIAMQGSSDLAKVKADAILLTDRLASIMDLFNHAGKARNIITQNLGWALLYNALALPLAAAGLVAPWQAALGMSLSSLFVSLNSMRLGKL